MIAGTGTQTARSYLKLYETEKQREREEAKKEM